MLASRDMIFVIILWFLEETPVLALVDPTLISVFWAQSESKTEWERRVHYPWGRDWCCWDLRGTNFSLVGTFCSKFIQRWTHVGMQLFDWQGECETNRCCFLGICDDTLTESPSRLFDFGKGILTLEVHFVGDDELPAVILDRGGLLHGVGSLLFLDISVRCANSLTLSHWFWIIV